MSQPADRVSMYIDGFNMYYGFYKPLRFVSSKPGTKSPPVHPSLKWLDLRKLGDSIIQEMAIPGTLGTVVYCTAKTLASAGDRAPQQRQELFLRALGTLPNVHVVFGNHVERTKDVVTLDQNGNPKFPPVPASIREEKGSDVNLAAYMIRDAAFDQFESAIVLSNDSDLATAVQITRRDFGKSVIVVSPQFRENGVVAKLAKAANRSAMIDPLWLRQCAMPDQVVDAKGRTINKPTAWN